MDIQLPTIDAALEQVSSNRNGLTSPEAAERLARDKSRVHKSGGGPWRLLLNQFRSPLVILLLVAMVISSFLGDKMDVVTVSTVMLPQAPVGANHQCRQSRTVFSAQRCGPRKASHRPRRWTGGGRRGSGRCSRRGRRQ